MSIQIPENLSLAERLIWLDGYEAALRELKDTPTIPIPQGWREGVQTDERYASAGNGDAGKFNTFPTDWMRGILGSSVGLGSMDEE